MINLASGPQTSAEATWYDICCFKALAAMWTAFRPGSAGPVRILHEMPWVVTVNNIDGDA